MSDSEVKTITYYYTRYGETASFEARHDKTAMAILVAEFGTQLLGIDHVWTDDANGDVHTVWIE